MNEHPATGAYPSDASKASSEIGRATERLNSNVGSLLDSIDALERRFGIVMLPSAPTAPSGVLGSGSAIASVKVTSPLADTLDRLADRLNGADNQIQDMLARCQL